MQILMVLQYPGDQSGLPVSLYALHSLFVTSLARIKGFFIIYYIQIRRSGYEPGMSYMGKILVSNIIGFGIIYFTVHFMIR